ncbi:MAG: hypothetical protein KAQ65_03035 [Candidatus Thorarchaeota archaeon]|nr:hypothetical protein [Candidatus Thorarchaeota archaeon]
MPAINFYICGTSGDPSDDNPITVARREQTINILSNLIQQPLKRDILEKMLSQEESSQIPNLKRLGIIDEKDSIIRLGFPVLTLDDYNILDESLDTVAKDLVNAFQDKWMAIEELVASMGHSADGLLEEGLYNIIGCVILDWMALKWLEKDGFVFYSKGQPNGTKYLLQGATEDAFERAYTRYCYSTTGGTEKWRFTIFGQTNKKRWGPPQAEMHIWGAIARNLDAPGELSKIAANYAQTALHHTLHHAVDVLTGDVPNSSTLATLLQCSLNDTQKVEMYLKEVGFIDVTEQNTWIPKIMILREQDRKNMEKVIELSRECIFESLTKSLEVIRDMYQNTTPGKHGVPFKESLTDLWHDIFSKAIILFIEKGQMKVRQTDPECGWNNFIWDNQLNLGSWIEK